MFALLGAAEVALPGLTPMPFSLDFPGLDLFIRLVDQLRKPSRIHALAPRQHRVLDAALAQPMIIE
ncbi:uncharacterized protein B0I36DRAFT_128827 [Microdochium trichocladiopsis]|uniref:Uncharacterized protein n=1 Tax=Microdochium trichocladiopsis TaxID=1682393 RepID=A0A9P8Y3Z1_9PEZI|nr:uncharacterized protein B0I36DRAFT_128827 [Microdochium trichocladiopsis]KAH7029147.1 hypothetical protein B0I36DRAFT_128827 [Microdochium trichocladiopsis]